MTFFEYMQQQTKRTDWIGYLATSAIIENRLFPSLQLKDANVEVWHKRLAEKFYGTDNFEPTFEQAVKEFSEVQSERD